MTARSATHLTGTVLDAWGTVVGAGLHLDERGHVHEIIPADPAQEPGAQGWITPGLIDVHNHGGGISFPDTTDAAAVRTAIDVHRRSGTTAVVASLVSMTDPLPALRALVTACESGDLLGVHLEGPYLSEHKAGAQNPAAIRPPDLDELRTWLAAGRGHIKTMTIAPELPGALAAAQLLVDYGARPSWGHTNATALQAREAIAATTQAAQIRGLALPAQTATHLFNAMPPLTHREPGPVREFLAAARRGELVVELVADGVHLAPELVGDVLHWADTGDPARPGAALVTDAMAGAGMPEGRYELGGLEVIIAGAVARLTSTGAIAGGTATLAHEVRTIVGGGHATMGQAIRAAVAGPARALGVDDSNAGVSLTFTPGAAANLVLWDAHLQVAQVYREGVRV